MTGSYLLFAGGYGGPLISLLFSPPTAESPASLVELGRTAEAGSSPTWIELSPDRRALFVVDQVKPAGSISQFALTIPSSLSPSTPPTLTLQSKIPTQGSNPVHFSLTSSAAIIAHYASGTLASLPIPLTSLTATSTQLFSHNENPRLGPNKGRQESSHPHGVHIDPLGKIAVVADLGTDELHVFAIGTDGKLKQLKSVDVLSPGAGPRHCCFDQRVVNDLTGDGKTTKLYLVNEMGNSIQAFLVSYPSSNKLPTIKLLPPYEGVSLLPLKPFPHQNSFDEWHAAEIVFLPPTSRSASDGLLIASNRAEPHDPWNADPFADMPNDLLAVYKVGEEGLPVPGKVKFVSGGRGSRGLSSSSTSTRTFDGESDGKEWIAEAAHDSDEVVVYERKSWEDGGLKEAVRLKGVGKPANVTWF